MDILNINGIRDDTKTYKHMSFQYNFYFFI